GRGQQDGKIKGQARYHLESGDYHGRVESIIHPRLLIPVLNSNQAAMVNSFVFRGPPIAIAADFSGRTENNDALWVSGLIQSSNFTYQTVPITSFKSRVGYTNGIIAFTAIRLVRPEGEFTGHLEENINSSIANLDLVSTVDPTAIARLAGPEIAAYLDGVRLGGPVRLAVRGCLDHDKGALTDIRAELDGSRLEYAFLDVDRCSLKLTVKQFRIDLTDIRAELYGGTMAGRAAFYPVGGITNFKYDVSLKGDDLNLNTLVKSLDYKGDEDYKGSIYSECTVSGFFGKDRNDTISGGGWVRIQDGQLFQRSLFGGFSRLFSILYPGIGTISLTDLSTKFTVQNQKVQVHHVTLSGPTFSLLGEGYYAFDETLDFIVWLQPPEAKTIIGWLSEIPQPLFSKLLVVRLTGTVSDPKWWPLNLTGDQLLALPKDLIVNMPSDVLKDLPKDLLTTLPKEVLGALPEKLFINLPKDLLNMLKPSF
ncbi:MAG: AsmA-like C-terminal region-containing protein, partial [Candidatus Marinimicrobia bacterium]|nr:AsmA-like C-terminal region-containing protein [Candidatus Neomarinimicrobiota bacterium]